MNQERQEADSHLMPITIIQVQAIRWRHCFCDSETGLEILESSTKIFKKIAFFQKIFLGVCDRWRQSCNYCIQPKPMDGKGLSRPPLHLLGHVLEAYVEPRSSIIIRTEKDRQRNSKISSVPRCKYCKIEVLATANPLIFRGRMLQVRANREHEHMCPKENV